MGQFYFTMFFTQNIKHLSNLSQMVQKVPKTFPNMSGKQIRNISENGLGRTRNRTRYRPDPTPRPVRGLAHWANPVTRKRVSRDFICIKITKKAAQNDLVSERAVPSNLVAEKSAKNNRELPRIATNWQE